ncbi:MAG: Asp/Glu racemase [Alphaproteobacteria bacterium]|nr:Asp/Glu racemase [Alphaproteobacteria bacterium]
MDLRSIPCEFAPPLGWAARLGLIVLASDHTIEFEWRSLVDAAARACGGPDSVALYAARIPNDPEITPETLAAMDGRIAQTADLLTPGVDCDVIAYGCTSAAMVLGSERVAKRVHSVRPGARVTDPAEAAVAAFEALGVRRLAMLTPYSAALNEGLRAGFQARGLDIPKMGSFGIGNDNDVARIAPASVAAAARDLGGDPEVEAVFVSCTSIRLIEVVDALEDALGKPVVSSNMALGWRALRLAGIDAPLEGFGRLFREA